MTHDAGLPPDAIPVTATPAGGTFHAWRVYLTPPDGVTPNWSFKGPRMRRCYLCMPDRYDIEHPETFAEIAFYYSASKGFAFGICPRCGERGGFMNGGQNGNH